MVLLLLAGAHAFAQAPADLATATALAQLSSAFSQDTAVNTVTLSGTAAWSAGSDHETGNVTLIAGVDGSYSLSLQLANSPRSEAQTSFSAGQDCTWSGTDGIAHPVVQHNCLGSMAWFLPTPAIVGSQQPSAVTTSLATPAGSSSLVDIRQQRVAPSIISSDAAAMFTHLSTSDLYLDPTSYLPSALSYNVHSDDNAGTDIPVQVLFTNYQSVNGVMIPFHIQRYINSLLNLDITVTQASVQ